MKTWVQDILCCPVDREAPLTLHAFRTSGDDVVDGALVCPKCGRWYAVMEGVAHLVRDGLREAELEIELLRRYRQVLPEEASRWRPYGSDALD